jgi:hypothetical protein
VFARASKGDGDYAAAIEGATVLLRSADAPTKPSYGKTIKRRSARRAREGLTLLPFAKGTTA